MSNTARWRVFGFAEFDAEDLGECGWSPPLEVPFTATVEGASGASIEDVRRRVVAYVGCLWMADRVRVLVTAWDSVFRQRLPDHFWIPLEGGLLERAGG